MVAGAIDRYDGNSRSVAGTRERAMWRQGVSVADATRMRQPKMATIDLITSSIGACICAVFIYNENQKDNPLPYDQIAGMIFTSSLCPIVMSWNFEFYQRWRNVLITIIRIPFIIGTTENYNDLWAERSPTFLGFLAHLLYASRVLVISWGCFGWPLPFPYHVVLQGCHVIAALRLTPVVCSVDGKGSYVPDSFASKNADRIEQCVNLLDVPLKMVWRGRPSIVEQQDRRDCFALNAWLLCVFGFMIPSYFLYIITYRSGGGKLNRIIQRDGSKIMLFASAAAWCMIRVFLP